jgi:hypothetical protein
MPHAWRHAGRMVLRDGYVTVEPYSINVTRITMKTHKCEEQAFFFFLSRMCK